MRKALTYDDVNIIPKYSELESRSDIDLKTNFTKKQFTKKRLFAKITIFIFQ